MKEFGRSEASLSLCLRFDNVSDVSALFFIRSIFDYCFEHVFLASEILTNCTSVAVVIYVTSKLLELLI